MGIISHFPGGGGGGVTPFLYSITNASVKFDTATSLKLNWTNPASETGWTGTKIVYKAGALPGSPTDGAVVDCGTTDYSSTAKIISGLTTGTRYYFIIMACSDDKINFGYGNAIDFTPIGIGTLETTSWADINTVAALGQAAEFWQVCDTKTITLPSAVWGSTVITVGILDFYYDDLVNSGSKAPITFGMVNCFGQAQRMVAANSNVDGYVRSELRPKIISEVDPYLDAAIGEGIVKPVYKRTSIGNTSPIIETSQEKYWCASEYEVSGTTSYSAPGEKPEDKTTCYAAYTDTASRIKRVGTAAKSYRLRSPQSSNTMYYCVISTSGVISVDYGSAYQYTHYIPLNFCV